jgi:hypothetical protein
MSVVIEEMWAHQTPSTFRMLIWIQEMFTKSA